MATVSSVLAGYGVRTGRGLEWDASQLKIHVYEVGFGATENYATGGISISFPGVSTVLAASYAGGDLRDYHVVYNIGTGKVQVFGQEPTDTTTGVIVFSELPNGSSVINGKTVRFLVVGR